MNKKTAQSRKMPNNYRKGVDVIYFLSFMPHTQFTFLLPVRICGCGSIKIDQVSTTSRIPVTRNNLAMFSSD